MKNWTLFLFLLVATTCYSQTDKGFKTLISALEEKEIKSQKDLGIYYSFGWEGFTKNRSLSMFWYQEAALRGDSEAQACMAEFYEAGELVRKNTQKAQYWYNLAANSTTNDKSRTTFIKDIKRNGGVYSKNIGYSYNGYYVTRFGSYDRYNVVNPAEIKTKLQKSQPLDYGRYSVELEVNSGNVSINLYFIDKKQIDLLRSLIFTPKNSYLVGDEEVFGVCNSDRQHIIWTREDNSVLLSRGDGLDWNFKPYVEFTIFGSFMTYPTNFEERYDEVFKILSSIFPKK